MVERRVDGGFPERRPQLRLRGAVGQDLQDHALDGDLKPMPGALISSAGIDTVR